MPLSTTANDLAQIVAQLSATIADQDQQITAATARLNELSQEAQSIISNRSNYSQDLVTTQAEVSRLRAAVTTAATDAVLAKGTSVEAQKQQDLAAARASLERAESQLSTLQESAAHDSQAEQDTLASILELQNQIAALVAEKQDAVAARQRWSRELCETKKAQGVEELTRGHAHIERLQAETSTALGTYDQLLRQVALDLAPLDERVCLDVLAEYGRWDDSPPEVIVAQAQLAEAEASIANAERMRAQVGADLDPTIIGYRQQVRALTARIERLRQQHRQDAALALLRQLRQPAPVMDTDLVQAQALAQAMAQVEVVVEEPAPTKEPYAPQRGQRAFGTLGTVPAPSPSLLRPHVKQTSS